MGESTEIRPTGTAKGRGVFALRDFANGEVVEEAPALLGKFGGGDGGAFKHLEFAWSKLIGQEATRLYQAAIALGNGSFYNSANPANMRYEADEAPEVIRFIAARAIAAGEELTINYSAAGGGTTSATDAWFDRMKVKPLK